MATSPIALARGALARGVLIIDEDLLNLIKPLERKNFKVYRFGHGLQDDQIASLPAHRILVTNNPTSFLEAAAIHEFSIIDTERCSKDPETLAQYISQAWIEERLRTRQPFIAKLNQDGTAVVTLIDE